MRRVLGCMFVLALGALAMPAAADDPIQCRQTAGPRPIVICDTIVIHGDRGPGYLYIPRSRDRYELPPLERNMTREVLRTVRREPF